MHPQRGNAFKSHPVLFMSFLAAFCISGFMYWRSSRLNTDLMERMSILQTRLSQESLLLKEANEKTEQAEMGNGNLRRELSDSKQKYVDELSERTKTENEKQEFESSWKKCEDDRQTIRKNVDEKTAQVESVAKELQDKTAELQASNKQLMREQNDKKILLEYVGEQLGREGVEYLVNQGVSLNQYQMPSQGQIPKCKGQSSDVQSQAQNAADTQHYNLQDRSQIKDQVSGEVQRPGLQELLAGKRREDQDNRVFELNKHRQAGENGTLGLESVNAVNEQKNNPSKEQKNAVDDSALVKKQGSNVSPSGPTTAGIGGDDNDSGVKDKDDGDIVSQ